MNQKEAEKIVYDYLSPIFIERGFKYIKSKYGFVKRYDGGFDLIGVYFLNYWPSQVPGYGIVRRFNIVEDIYNILIEKFNFNPYEADRTFWFSYESVNAIHSNSYLPPAETEAEMLDNARKIKEFMLEVGFPMLGKYSTLQAIDAEINGDDFWSTDWQHKFTLGGGGRLKD